MHLQKGTSLLQGKYIIDSVLGQGGFGITYLATQTSLNRQVAIKEFFIKDYCGRESDTTLMTVGSGFSSELVEQYKRKFIKEAQTIAGLDNPHIIRIHDVFEENGTAYYVMEYLQFGNLQQRIPDKGMNHKDAYKYILQIAEALNYVHNHGILHLDVKPSNVMFRSIDQAVLIDFGNAKHFNKERDGYTSTIRPGISEGYAPLEQYEMDGNNKFTSATDVYALGATFYHLLTGERPPGASSVINGLPPFDKMVPHHIQRTVQSAMKPAKEDRLQNVQQFFLLLDVKTDIDNVSRKNGRRQLKIYIGILTGGLVLAAAIFGIWGSTGVFTKNSKKVIDIEQTVISAQQGDAHSQLMMGLWHELGENGFQKDSVMAREWYTKAAQQGNIKAQLCLGNCYEFGIGVEKDMKIAFDWYLKAAQQGELDAVFNVGVCYQEGAGTEQNFNKAVEYYLKAAEEGHPDAQFNLALSYYKGQGVVRDTKEIIHWFTEAAEQGHAEAQCQLGLRYLNGEGVKKNVNKSLKWFKKAAEQGNAEAQFHYGRLHQISGSSRYDRDVALHWLSKSAIQGFDEAQYYVAKLLAPEADEVVAKNNGKENNKSIRLKKEVIQWYTKAAQKGHAEAQESLGECYESGWGVEQNDTIALRWYEKAAGEQNSFLQMKVASMYGTGKGSPINYKKATEWTAKAAKNGNADAQYILGLAYEEGMEISLSYETAFEWFMKAAEQGHAKAQSTIGYYYHIGRGTDMNILKAMEWYEKAVEQDDKYAQFNLALIYDRGEYVEQNNSKAFDLYRKAALQGHVKAQYELGSCYYMGRGVKQDKYKAAMWFKKAAEQGNLQAKEALEKTGLN